MSDGIWVSGCWEKLEGGRLLSSQSYVDLKAAMRIISLRREVWLLFLAGPARLDMANFWRRVVGLVQVSLVVDGQGRLAPVRVKRRTGQQRMRASSCFGQAWS